jgi:hypothetical protein
MEGDRFIYIYMRIKFFLVRFEVITAVVMKSTIFWDITPYSPLKVNRRFGGTCRLQPPAVMLVSCSAYYSNLKM